MAVSGACPSHYCVTSLISDALGDQRRSVSMGSGDAYRSITALENLDKLATASELLDAITT